MSRILKIPSLYSYLLILFSVCFHNSSTAISQTINSGFRASRILSSFPNRKFPDKSYWLKAGKELSGNFNNSTPSGIWIVSLYWESGMIGMDFPSDGHTIPNVTFMGTDFPESYLSSFDTSGIKIWLQIEPGAANIDTLIDLVLNRYKRHKCIAGFGIDVEWYLTHQNQYGKKVSDDEAERWEKRVKTHNPEYTLFLKHFSQSWMPPNYRGNIIFVDDSQGFYSVNNLVNEFKSWGAKFEPNKVWFQYGYVADSKWWSGYTNPMKSIGDQLINGVPNLGGLFWVDFSIIQIIPLSIKTSKSYEIPNGYKIRNYPNPFNPETTIEISDVKKEHIELAIFDIYGRKIKKLWDGMPESNIIKLHWNGCGENFKCSSGTYFLKLNTRNSVFMKKITLLR